MIAMSSFPVTLTKELVDKSYGWPTNGVVDPDNSLLFDHDKI